MHNIEILIYPFQVFKRAKVSYKDIVCTDYEAVNTADLNKLYLGEGQQLDVFQSWLDEMNSLTSKSVVNYTFSINLVSGNCSHKSRMYIYVSNSQL